MRLAAVLFALQVVLACTGLPRGVRQWFMTTGTPPQGRPDVIVVLGGGGIPSGSGLLRAYYAAAQAHRAPNAAYIVALPRPTDSPTSHAARMRDELMLRGVPAEQIRIEGTGRNTYEQACRIRAMLGRRGPGRRLLLVTSPSHMRRAALCFRRQGFTKVAGCAAMNTGVGGELGAALNLRYGLWSRLHGHVDLLRETCALLYYKLRGWI